MDSILHNRITVDEGAALRTLLGRRITKSQPFEKPALECLIRTDSHVRGLQHEVCLDWLVDKMQWAHIVHTSRRVTSGVSPEEEQAKLNDCAAMNPLAFLAV
jgi:hypothetical protein